MTALDAMQFETVILPHLDAAYNLACWLVRDRSAAEDIVQEALLRSLKYFSSYRGTNAKAWLLKIVRNAAWHYLQARQEVAIVSIDNPTDDDREVFVAEPLLDGGEDPVITLIRQREKGYLMKLIDRLPIDLRECLVLRELEELSYSDIASVADIPIGTVMSRLFRARRLLIEAAQEGAR